MKKLLLGLSACVAVAVITMAQVPVSITPGSANYVLAIDGSATVPSMAFSSESGTGFYKSAANVLTYTTAGVPRTSFSAGNFFMNSSAILGWVNNATITSGSLDTQITRAGVGQFGWSAVLFANLGTPASGSFCYCSDCTIANPCASGGTGALAKRLNGVWVCN